MSTLTKCVIISFYCLFGFFNQTGTAQTENQGLFDNESPLKMALSGKLPPFFEDPSKTPRKYAQVLSYQEANGQTIKIPIEVKARGHFRRLRHVNQEIVSPAARVRVIRSHPWRETLSWLSRNLRHL